MKTNDFGKLVKIELVKREKNQEWLISKIKKKTGLFVDSSYLNRILTGQSKSPRIISAIKDILQLDYSE